VVIKTENSENFIEDL
jgi:hypothetical protein